MRCWKSKVELFDSVIQQVLYSHPQRHQHRGFSAKTCKYKTYFSLQSCVWLSQNPISSRYSVIPFHIIYFMFLFSFFNSHTEKESTKLLCLVQKNPSHINRECRCYSIQLITTGFVVHNWQKIQIKESLESVLYWLLIPPLRHKSRCCAFAFSERCILLHMHHVILWFSF